MRTLFSLLALGVLALAAQASAQIYEPVAAPWLLLQDSASSSGGGSGGGLRLTLDAGPADNDIDGFIQVDEIDALGGLVTLGTPGDFKDNFNFESESSNRIGGKLQAGFFSLEVATQDVKFTSDRLSGTLTIFGRSVDVTQPAQTEVDMPYMQVKLGFELNSPEPAEGDWLGFGIGIGVHVFDFSFTLDARENITNTIIDEDAEFTAPLPTLGLMFGVYPSESISIEASLWALVVPSIEFDGGDVEGSIFDLNVVGKYYILDNVAIGGRLGMVMLNVESSYEDDSDRFTGDLEISSIQISAVVGISF